MRTTVPAVLRDRSWVAIHHGDDQRIAAHLRGWQRRVRSLAVALEGTDGHVITIVGPWTVVFSPPDQGLDPVEWSGDGEALGFEIREARDRFCAIRARRGQPVRSVVSDGGEVVQSGRPGRRREPDLGAVDGTTVLALGRAWGCDVAAAVDGKTRASVIIPYGHTEPRSWSRRWSVRILAAVAMFFAVRWGCGGSGAGEASSVAAVEASCLLQPTFTECVRCLLWTPPHPCAERRVQCSGTPACAALSRCLEDCSTEVGCLGRCEALHPDGIRMRSALMDCAACGICADAFEPDACRSPR